MIMITDVALNKTLNRLLLAIREVSDGSGREPSAPTAMARLVSRLGISPAHLSAALSEAERRGYVDLERTAKGIQGVCLTGRGHTMAEQALRRGR